MQTLLLIVHIFVSVVLILVVLLQSGRGGGMGAAFGGASQQIFGGRGAGSFLARVTTACAIIFFLTSLTLSMISSRERSVIEKALDAKKQTEAAQAPEAKDAATPELPTPAGDAVQPGEAGSPEAAVPSPETAPEPTPAPTPPPNPPPNP